jgi:hypothetical protein
VGVRGLPTDFATVHIYAGTPETGAKLAKTILHLRKLSTAAGADLQVVASGRYRAGRNRRHRSSRRLQ